MLSLAPRATVGAIGRVGIVGAGQTGRGIAEVCTRAGLSVTLCDTTDERARAGLAGVADSLLRAEQKGTLTAEDRAHALAGITVTAELSHLAGADPVVEAAVEDEEAKTALFRQLDRAVTNPDALLAGDTSSIPIARLAAATGRPQAVAGLHFFNPVPVIAPGGGDPAREGPYPQLRREDALLASNTSSLSIMKLGMATARPHQVIGVHFFNPVPVLELVEIVPSLLTGDQTQSQAEDFITQVLGKKVIRTQDRAGLVVHVRSPSGVDFGSGVVCLPVRCPGRRGGAGRRSRGLLRGRRRSRRWAAGSLRRSLLA